MTRLTPGRTWNGDADRLRYKVACQAYCASACLGRARELGGCRLNLIQRIAGGPGLSGHQCRLAQSSRKPRPVCHHGRRSHARQCAINNGKSACCMMWLVAPPKIICRNLLLVKAPLTSRSQPSALAAARTASPVLRPSNSMLMVSAAIPLYCNCFGPDRLMGPARPVHR